MTSAAELIANAKALLLDFDGPVTALMPPPLNIQAAGAAKMALEGIELPDEILSTTDHLRVLRWTLDHVPSRLVAVEEACAIIEVDCARTSDPSPEIRDFMTDAEDLSIPVAIVSNNSEEAVRVFLERFKWARRIKTIACRSPAKVSLMKPSPTLVQEALERLELDPGECVFVGDSVSDVQAGHLAGVPVVGLAKTRARERELKDAGADALLRRGRR